LIAGGVSGANTPHAPFRVVEASSPARERSQLRRNTAGIRALALQLAQDHATHSAALSVARGRSGAHSALAPFRVAEERCRGTGRSWFLQNVEVPVAWEKAMIPGSATQCAAL